MGLSGPELAGDGNGSVEGDDTSPPGGEPPIGAQDDALPSGFGQSRQQAMRFVYVPVIPTPEGLIEHDGEGPVARPVLAQREANAKMKLLAGGAAQEIGVTPDTVNSNFGLGRAGES